MVTGIADTDKAYSVEGGHNRAWFPLGDGTYHSDPYYAAAVRGDAFCRKKSGYKPGDSDGGVVTDSDARYDLGDGEVVYVTSLFVGITSAGDEGTLEFGTTDSDNGGGDFTALTPLFDFVVPATKTDPGWKRIALNPPLKVTQSAGVVETITWRMLTPSDSDTQATLSFQAFTASS